MNLQKTNEKTHKISNESKSKFSYSQGKIAPVEEHVENKPERKEDLYMQYQAKTKFIFSVKLIHLLLRIHP